MTLPADKVLADPLDITYGEMLPFLSWRELRHRGFLGPGIATALFGIAMFVAANLKEGGQIAVLYILSGFLGLASLYLINLWCGRKMPFWYVFLVALITFAVNAFLLIPIVGWANDRLLPFPLAPALTEEPWKALPLLLIWAIGRRLRPMRQRKYGVREPLDGIILAAASATAFAFVETMFQYMPKYGAGVGPPRFLLNVYGHIAFSAMFGYYVGLAALHHYKPRRVVAALCLGVLLAGGLHDLWDAPPYLLKLVPHTFISALALGPLWQIVICMATLMILGSMILKGRELSPEREFLWPFGSIPAFRAPLIQPLPEMPFMPGECWLAVGTQRLRLIADATLSGADIPCLAPAGVGAPVAQVMPHPDEPAMLVLRNLSRSTWEVVRTDGTVRDVAPAETIRLIPGTRIDFGTMAGAVLLAPHDAIATAAATLGSDAAAASGNQL
jgi:RsiW-degrading membrane proteinase PrsW (M82 family)